MTDATALGLRWAYHAGDGHLWVRFTRPVTGSLWLATDQFDDATPVVHLDREGCDHSIDLRDLAGTLAALKSGDRFALYVGTGGTQGAVRMAAGSPGLIARVPVLLPDGSGATVTVQAEKDTTITLGSRPRAPWAEIERIGTIRSQTVITGQLQPGWPQGDRPDSELLLVDRNNGAELRYQARRTGSHFEATVDLDDVLVHGVARTWNVSLVVGLQRHRLGRHLFDVENLGRAAVIPGVEYEGDGEAYQCRPRYTDRNNLVIETATRSADQPVPDETWWHDSAELLGARTDDGSDDPAAPLPGSWLVRGIVALLLNALRWRRPRRPRGGGGSRRPVESVHLLIANRHAIGGTVRATVNTANALVAAGERVELTSVYRLEDIDSFPVDPRVRTRVLVDEVALAAEPGSWAKRWFRDRARGCPSMLVPSEEPRAYRFSLWSDLQVARFLRRLEPTTLITTRAALSIIAPRYVPAGVTVIAQQHVPFRSQPASLQQLLIQHYRRCAAICVLTEADAREVRRELGTDGPPVTILANPLDAEPPWEPDSRPERIVCGGRLSPVKGSDLLLRAFAAADIPASWELRMIGPARRDRLAAMRSLAEQLGLSDRVLFPPPTHRMDLELARARLCVVPSRHEAFGMIIIEAMRAGVPVIAFDCPEGPGEIITDGVDGVLVPAEDVAALAAAIERCTADDEWREHLSCGGRRTAERYLPSAVARDLRSLVDDVRAR